MKLMTPLSISLTVSMFTACGVAEKPPADDPVTVNNATNSATNNTTTPDEDQPDMGPPDLPDGGGPTEEVEVDCVSDLVTHGGNYYALSAKVAGNEALVEMVHYLAATPTSDPEELILWTRAVEATFTVREFAFETQDAFLDVARADDSQMYVGTMSGNNEFEGPVEVRCWPADLEISATYDPATGRCVDELGNDARNDLPWMYAVRTGFGQCATFEGQLNGEAFGYPTFDFLDLRGADLNGAALNFADITDSQLEGADLRQFEFGYSTVAGTVDAFTQLPELAECEHVAGETQFSCTR